MALPSDISQALLREFTARIALGQPIPSDAVEAMIDTLDELLDEAGEADEPNASIDDLHGLITSLEKLRVDAIQEKDDAEETYKEELLTLKKEIEEKDERIESLTEEKPTRDELIKEVETLKANAKTFERDARRLSTALEAIAEGSPADAWRAARIALGREIIEATDTARIPTRAERKRAKAGG